MGWLLAFLVHSTLWLSLAWLWTRLRPGMHARVREMIWYTAIAASRITPTVQALAPAEAAFWRLPVPVALASSPAGDHRATETSAAAHDAREGAEHRGAPLSAEPPPARWRALVPWAWLTVAGVLLLGCLGRIEALRRRIGRREDVRDPRALLALDRLRRRAGLSGTPRLTVSADLGSPIALGIGRSSEICVPTRALHELDREELRALLGHEIAHHMRHDALRLAALNALQAAFFFQPLLRLAARGIHRAAEEQCDDWAAMQIEDRLAMASCLTEVAAWVLRRDRRLPVPCTARRRSQLGRRVDRLMDERRSSEAPGGFWRGLGCVGLLAAAPWLAPSLAPTGEPPHEDPVGGEHGPSAGEHRGAESESSHLEHE